MPFRIIEYRAVAMNVLTSDMHPIQAISHSMHDIDDWAHLTRDKYNCVVKVFVVREILLKHVKPKVVKKKEEPKKLPQNCRICGNLLCTKHINDKQERLPG